MLDKSTSYGQIFGQVEGYPRARYIQNGKFFDPKGNEIVFDKNDIVEEEKEDFRRMHWKKLKQRVVAAGGEWHGREAAIQFLNDQNPFS